MTQALYNKWRPRKWDEVVGQQHVVQTLRNAILGDRVVHAYLFAGPRGTGKTTVARLLAKAVNCLDPDPANRPCNTCAHCVAVNEGRFLDLVEIDAASTNSVDDVRALRDKINFTPNQGKYRIYIIDEVHMLSTPAFNAILKTLEEPPPHAIFILATTEIHKIPATVLSRCQRHEFRRVPVDDIVHQLERIVESEKLVAEPESLILIARQSAGGMRDAISLLDQMASTGQEITLGLTQLVLGTATSQTVVSLVAAVLDRKASAGMDAIHGALDAGTDPRLLARQVVDYLRTLLLIQMGNVSSADLSAEVRKQAEKQAKAFPTSELLRMIKAFNLAAADLRGGWQPSLPLELALAGSLELPAPSPAAPASPPPAAPPPEAASAAREKSISQKVPPPQGKKAQQVLYQSADPREETATKPASATAPASVEANATGVVTLEQVSKAWKQIRALIKPQSQMLDGLLNSCRLLEIRGGVLIVGFASDVLRKKMDSPEQLEITRKAIAQVCGVELSVKCVVSTAKQNIPPDVKADGMVAAALKAGGEIVDTQE